MDRSSGVELHSSTICGLRCVYAVELRPKLRFIQDIRRWTQFCTTIYAVRTQCNYKSIASYGATAQFDYAYSAKSQVTCLRRLGACTRLQTSLNRFTSRVYYYKSLSNDLIMTIVTNIRLPICITLYVLNNHYISCVYVVLYDET